MKGRRVRALVAPFKLPMSSTLRAFGGNSPLTNLRRREKFQALARCDCVWQTSLMKPNSNQPQCHEDRKAQKLLERIHKKLQEKGTNQNSIHMVSQKPRRSVA